MTATPNLPSLRAPLPHRPRRPQRHEPRGRPSFLCRGCGRRFVDAPRKGPVSDERKALVLRLLGERMALRAIARVTGLSRSWLQRFVNALYRERTPHEPGPLPKRVATW